MKFPVKIVVVVAIGIVFFPAILAAADRPATRQSRFITSIQVSSFKRQKAAQREIRRLKSYGVEAFTRHEPVQGKGMWYRVYVGKFGSKRKALAYAHTLKQKGIISWSWVKRIQSQGPAVKPAPPRKDKRAPKERPTAPAPPTPAVAKVPKAPPVQAQKAKPDIVAAPKAVPPPQPRVIESPPEKDQELSPRPSKTTTQPKAKSHQQGRFSMGVRGDGLYSTSISDFHITRTAGGTTNWLFDDYAGFALLTADLRVSDRWTVNAGVGQSVLSKLEMPFFSVGTKVRLTKTGTIRPYLRAALIYADLSWDEAPGEFDSTLGADLGIGIDYALSRWTIGLDAGYRQLSFDYQLPSDPSVTATDSEVDFSGILLTVGARFHF